MALTVEELQIKLGCDATQAQDILKQMDATVKAYTEKFQKYFQTKNGNVKPLDGVAKEIDKGVKQIEAKVNRAKKIIDFTPKYKSTNLTYKDVANDIAAKARAGREAAKAYDKEFAKARPNGTPNAKLLSLGAETAKGIQAVYNAAKPLGIVTGVLREKIFRAYTAMRDLGKEYQKVASEQGVESAAGQKAEQAYLKAIYAVDKYVQQLGKAIAKEEELAQKRATADPEQVHAGNINAENNPSLPDLVNGFVMKTTDALAKVGSAIGKAFTVGSKIAVGALQIIGTVAQSVAGAVQRVFQGVASSIKTAFRTAVSVVKRVGGGIKKAFNHTLLGKFINRLKTVALRMAAMKLIRGTIDGVKKGLEELAKISTSSAKAMNTIKAAGGSIKMALGAAVMPIVKALAPLFVNLAGAISSACNALARFFAVVTGQSTYTAVNFSNSLDNVASSAGGAGKSVKGMLADFDELHVIEKNSGGGGGGGSGVETSLSTVSDLTAVSELGTRIKEAIESGDWTDVGTAVNEKIEGISTQISNWAKNLKNSDIGSNLAEFFNGLFGEESTFYDLGSSIGGVLDGIITQVANFINNANWKDAGNCIKAFFRGLSDALENNEYVLKIKIKFNEFLRFLAEKKVAILEWANDLPDWMKFGHDFEESLENARKELEETTAEGERLRKKLEEIQNANVGVTIVVTVQNELDSYGIFKHGSTGGIGGVAEDATIPVHIRPEGPTEAEKVDETELFKYGTAQRPHGSSWKLGMNVGVNPEAPKSSQKVDEGSMFKNGAVKFSGGGGGRKFGQVDVTVRPEEPKASQKLKTTSLFNTPGGLASTSNSTTWAINIVGTVSQTVDSLSMFSSNSGVRRSGGSGGGMMVRVDILPQLTNVEQFATNVATKVTQAREFQAYPKLGSITAYESDIKRLVLPTRTVTVNPAYGDDTSFWTKLKEKITGTTQKVNINPTYNDDTSFFTKLKEKITGIVSKTNVNPNYGSDSTFFSNLKDKITGKTFGTTVKPELVTVTTAAVNAALKNLPTSKSVTMSVTASLTNGQALRKALEDTLAGMRIKIKATVSGNTSEIGSINLQVPHLASGGLAYGFTSAVIGEYSGARNNPEVVAPLSDLTGILARANIGGNKDSMTKEQANTMISLLQRIEQKENVIQPSVGLGQVVQRSLDAYART